MGKFLLRVDYPSRIDLVYSVSLSKRWEHSYRRQEKES